MVSKGLDRDRAVDETGYQVAVFGRRGARSFTLTEMQRRYLRNGAVWAVVGSQSGFEAATLLGMAQHLDPDRGINDHHGAV